MADDVIAGTEGEDEKSPENNNTIKHTPEELAKFRASQHTLNGFENKNPVGKSDTDITEIFPGAAQQSIQSAKERYFAKGGGKPPLASLDSYFTQGREVDNGACTVETKLGQGGMCHVYTVIPNNEKLAEMITSRGMDVHPKLREAKKLALKVLMPAIADAKDEGSRNVERFVQEAALMSTTFDHPDIVKVFDCFETNGYHCMIEEYVPGAISLDLALKNGRKISPKSAEIASRKALNAILHSHDNEVIWRDAAPKNMLAIFSPDGEIKDAWATDWGISRAKTGRGIEHLIQDSAQYDLGQTKTGQLFGTPSYVSPEQIQDTKNAEYPADFFSLGATFYHLATGQLPFVGGTDPLEVMRKIVSRAAEYTPTLPNTVIAKRRETEAESMKAISGSLDENKLPHLISDEMQDVIMMLLEKDEEKRIRRNHIVRLFDEIEKNELYEKRELSPEEIEATGKDMKKLFDEIALKERKATGSEGGLGAKLEIAEMYAKLGEITPREIPGGIIPEFSREDAFLFAVKYYKEVYDNFDASQIPFQMAAEQVEDAMHMAECRRRVEKTRVDQLALEIAGSKVNADIGARPGGIGGLLGGNSAYKKKITDTANALLDSTEEFIKKEKYLAAQAKFDQIKAFCNEHDVGKEIYQRRDAVDNLLAYEKEYGELALTLQSTIEEMTKSTKRKRFTVAEKAAQIIRKGIDEFDKDAILATRYGHLKSQFNFALDEYAKSKEEHDNFTSLVEELYTTTQEYRLKQKLLDSESMPLLAKLKENKAKLKSIEERAAELNTELVGQEFIDEFQAMMNTAYATHDTVSTRLAEFVYQTVDSKVTKLEEISKQASGRFIVEDGLGIVQQTRDLIKGIDGPEGLTNLDTDYSDQAKITSLQKRIETQRQVQAAIEKNISTFIDLQEKTKIGNPDEVRASACRDLSKIYIKEGTLDDAISFFDMMPLASKTPAMSNMFEAYRRTEDRTSFTKKTRDGLNQEDIVKLIALIENKIYDIRAPADKRDDMTFDTYMKKVAKGVGIDVSPALSAREQIDTWNSVKTSYEEQIKIYEADRTPHDQMKKQATEAGRKIIEEAARFITTYRNVVTAAQTKLAEEGLPQPKNIEDYRIVAAGVANINPALSAEYYDKLVTRLPETHPEMSELQQRVNSLRQKAGLEPMYECNPTPMPPPPPPPVGNP